MADQHRARPGLDPRLEGQEILGHKLLIGPLVNGNSSVGIHVVAIAWEVLKDAANLVVGAGEGGILDRDQVHRLDHLLHILRRGRASWPKERS